MPTTRTTASKPAPAPRAWQRMLSGRRLDLLDPSPLDIEIEDIAHGLARVHPRARMPVPKKNLHDLHRGERHGVGPRVAPEDERRVRPNAAVEERVHVVGTPQFDPYADTTMRWTREEFFARLGGDPSRKLICFSGNNSYNGIEDPAQLRTLMEFIRSGRLRVTSATCGWGWSTRTKPESRCTVARYRAQPAAYAFSPCWAIAASTSAQDLTGGGRSETSIRSTVPLLSTWSSMSWFTP